MLKVRGFDETDRIVLQEIYLASRRQAFHWLAPSSFQLVDFDRDTEGEKILVAEDDGGVAGFISIWMPDNFIHHLFVHPDFTGKGIGKALLGASVALLNGTISLKCLKRNKKAVGFYKAQGWVIEGEGSDDAGGYYLMRNK